MFPMAGEIQKAVTRFPWVTPSGGAVVDGGLTADEVKVHQGQAPATVESQPIAQRAPMEFIAPARSSDHLRLAVPEAANPFATPTGPRHDHMMVRTALQRSHTDTSKQLVGMLREPPKGLKIASDSVERMRASLAREHAMLGLLENLQEMQDQVYGRIIGSQEA
jgi:hypothetical protein